MSDYTYDLQIYDYGTERHLKVFFKGQLIAHVDPFPQGIPLAKSQQKRLVRLAINRAVDDHRKNEKSLT